MMDLRKLPAQAHETITRVENLVAAFGRARAERDDSAAKAEAAEDALTHANADRLIGDAGDVDLDGLRKDAERTRSESVLAERSVADVQRRLRQGANDLGQAKGELESALAERLEQERATIAAAARDALTPLSARLADLEKLSPSNWAYHGAVISVVDHALGSLTESAKAAPAAKLGELDVSLIVTCQQALRELAALEAGIREQLAQLTAKGA
jgi:hypothetical protein